MADSCAGRIALVTGASRGIGKGTAIRLAAEGADVAVLARATEAVHLGWSMGQTVTEIERLGRRALALEVDLGDPSVDRYRVIDQVEAELGPLDILVNNAAAGGYRYFADWDDADLRRMQEVNVWAPWQLTRRALQGMRERGRGWVVNVSSAAAELPVGPPFSASMVARRGAAYGSTKAMLNRFTASLAVELYGTGIAVNAVSPRRRRRPKAFSLRLRQAGSRRSRRSLWRPWWKPSWPSVRRIPTGSLARSPTALTCSGRSAG